MSKRTALLRTRLFTAGIVLGVMLVFSVLGVVSSSASVAVSPTATMPAPGRVPDFSHVVVIVFENQGYSQIIGNPAAPNFNSLARRYALLTNYYAVTHPSLPNYIAMVSGSTYGFVNCTKCRVGARSLADTLDAVNRSWKVYAEGLPYAGFTGNRTKGLYVRWHVPFFNFEDVAKSRARRQQIVPLSSLAGDLRSHTLPDFSLIVPNICHDMESCPVSTGDAWLGDFLPHLLSSPEMKRGVVFIVVDESVWTDTAHGGGHVPVIVAGPLVRPGVLATGFFDHYGLLRTIERAWQLPLIGQSGLAAPITGIWR